MRMRKLRVVVRRTRDGVPALVMATLLPASALYCGGSTTIDGGASTSGAGAGGAGGQGGTAGHGAGGFGGIGPFDAGTDADAGLCQPYEWEETFVVEVPPVGVPAEPGQLCSATADPVESNRAAFVTLNRYSQALHLATGAVLVPPQVLGAVSGLPSIAVVQADYPQMMDMQVTNIEQSPGGFTFHAEWPQPFDIPPDEWARMTVRATFTLLCVDGTPKQVQSDTHIHLCADFGGPVWVSSGEQCTTCTQICEMAPGPLGPEDPDDELPLAHDMRVALRALAKVGRSMVVLAEHDGGQSVHHEWTASAGEVHELAPDVVLWTAPDTVGPHQLTVAVTGPDRAAVASLPLA